VLLISSARFHDHITPPGHPERPERAHIFDTVSARWLQKGGRVEAPRPATPSELADAHSPEYLEMLEGVAGRAVMLDPDTFTSDESIAVAKLAAGASVQAAHHAHTTGEPAFALVRPPGHHAESGRAMGFCLYNNAAVAAAALVRAGVERVAVVDIDVHHGNGTQEIFYGSQDVLYVSMHQFPFYPGTGAAGETGSGSGDGFTVNVPMEAGSGDADYGQVCRTILEPVLEQFAPVVTIVSAGFDAHERDPLASMRLTTRGYTDVIRRLRDVARLSGSALAVVTEGGYELTALAACLEASFAVLDDVAGTEEQAHSAGTATHGHVRGDRAVKTVQSIQAGRWRF
jgi:acetoin utilization deacetylase AcuC-like enzyme